MDSLQTCRQLPTSFPLSLLDLPLVSELPKCWGGGRGRGDWSKNVEMEGEGREGQTKKKGEKRRGEGRVMGGREGSEKPWKEKKEREDEERGPEQERGGERRSVCLLERICCEPLGPWCTTWPTPAGPHPAWLQGSRFRHLIHMPGEKGSTHARTVQLQPAAFLGLPTGLTRLWWGNRAGIVLMYFARAST